MIDGAGISEEGTHDELMKLGGKYEDFYEMQSKYYREGDADHGEEQQT